MSTQDKRINMVYNFINDLLCLTLVLNLTLLQSVRLVKRGKTVPISLQQSRLVQIFWKQFYTAKEWN